MLAAQAAVLAAQAAVLAAQAAVLAAQAAGCVSGAVALLPSRSRSVAICAIRSYWRLPSGSLQTPNRKAARSTVGEYTVAALLLSSQLTRHR